MASVAQHDRRADEGGRRVRGRSALTASLCDARGGRPGTRAAPPALPAAGVPHADVRIAALTCTRSRAAARSPSSMAAIAATGTRGWTARAIASGWSSMRDGRFVTQRELPRMALIGTALEDGRCVLCVPGASRADAPRRRTATRATSWSGAAHVRGLDAGDAAAGGCRRSSGATCGSCASTIAHAAPLQSRLRRRLRRAHAVRGRLSGARRSAQRRSTTSTRDSPRAAARRCR